MGRQTAKQAHAEQELRSQVETVRDQLQAAHADADRKQAVVGNLSEVSGAPLHVTRDLFSSLSLSEVPYALSSSGVNVSDGLPKGVYHRLCVNLK